MPTQKYETRLKHKVSNKIYKKVDIGNRKRSYVKNWRPIRDKSSSFCL